MQITDDHSLVEEMVRRGEITRRRGARSPAPPHLDTRALGIDRTVEVDSWLIYPQGKTRLLLVQ